MQPRFLLSLLMVGLTATTARVSGRDEGTINFCNRMPAAEPAFDAPVFGPDGTTRLGESSYSGYLAQLYVGSSPTALLPRGQPVPFESGPLAGYVFGGTVAVGIEVGNTVFVQMRTWCELDGATYEAAQGANGRYGASRTIQVLLSGYLLPPADLVGLHSFSVTGVVTPPYLAAIEVLDTGVFEITATNLTGFTWTVMASSDLARPLANWDVVGPLSPRGGDRYLFIDPAYSSARQRFYRLRRP